MTNSPFRVIRALILAAALLLHPFGAGADPFFIPDERIDWRSSGKTTFTSEELRVLDEITQSPPIEAIRRLGFIISFVHNSALTKIAIERLISIEGWQDSFETLALESKQAWDSRSDKKQHPERPARGDFNFDVRLFYVLEECARAGITDAVLISAPFLFDSTDMERDDASAVPAERAIRVMVSADRKAASWNDSRYQGNSWEEQRSTWCQWWIAHAREYGAEPPASGQASFDDVLKLCRAGRRAHANVSSKAAVPIDLLELNYANTPIPSKVREALSRIVREMLPEVKEYFDNKDGSAPTQGMAKIIRHRRDLQELLKSKVIEHLRRMAYPLPGYFSSIYERELFDYGDEVTVNKLASKFYDEGDAKAGHILTTSQNPYVVGLMGPYLFDPFPFRNEGLLSKQMMTAWKLVELIPTCVEFSPEVRSWSETLHRLDHSNADWTIILQKWWRENENAFKERAYDRVRPGDIAHVGIMPPDLQPHLRPAQPSPAPPVAQDKIAAPVLPKPETLATLNPPVTESMKTRVLWMVGIFALGIVVGMLLRRSRWTG